MFLFSQLHFIELLKFQFFLRYKKIGTKCYVVCDASQSPIRTLPKMLIEKLSRWSPKLEKKVKIDVVKTVFTIGYYCLHIILFGPNLIILYRLDVLPTTEISVIFLHISVGNETPTQSQVKLIVKMALTPKWLVYVSNVMCCFCCFIICVCFCWSWTNGGMWRYSLTKQRISIWNWWLRRQTEVFIKWWWWFLLGHFW